MLEYRLLEYVSDVASIPARTPEGVIGLEIALPDTSVVVFTRDLRIRDHIPLATAARESDRVLPLFVLDQRILGSGFTSPARGCVPGLPSER